MKAELRDKLAGTLSTEGVSFWRWYCQGMGLLALGAFTESLDAFGRIILGPADDGRSWTPSGRTEYGLACVGAGLAFLGLNHKGSGEAILDEAMGARFYTRGVRNSYFGPEINIVYEGDEPFGVSGREVELVRAARKLLVSSNI